MAKKSEVTVRTTSVFCVSPNNRSSAHMYDMDMVKSQLRRYCALRDRGSFAWNVSAFLKRYGEAAKEQGLLAGRGTDMHMQKEGGVDGTVDVESLVD